MSASAATSASTPHQLSFPLPRITISYCTQCRWMLRAAYFAQELLTTFSTAIGEIALQPATGGLFAVHLTYIRPFSHTAAQTETSAQNGNDNSAPPQPETVLLWDRKAEGGFPETKVLKQRVRDHIQPSKELGHSDTADESARQREERRVVTVAAAAGEQQQLGGEDAQLKQATGTLAFVETKAGADACTTCL